MSKEFPPFVFSSPCLSPLCSPIRCFNEEIRLPKEINRAIFNKLLQVGRITYKDWIRIHTEIGIEYGIEYDAYMFSPFELRRYFKSMLIKQIRYSVYGLDQQSENFKKLLYPFLLKVNRIDVKFKCEGPVPPVSESQIPVQQALILYKLTMMGKPRFNSDVYNRLRNVRGKSFEIHVENPEFGLKPKQKSKLCGASQGQISRVAVNQTGPIDTPPLVTNEEEEPTNISIIEPSLPETPDSPLATFFVQGEELPTASPTVEVEEVSTQAPAEFSIGDRILPPRMETNEIVNQTDISGNSETKMEYIRYFIQEFANMPLETQHALYCKTDQLSPEIENENLPMTYPEWYKKNYHL